MERSDIGKAEDFIRTQLASGPKFARDVISASGIPERTVQRAARSLGVRRSREGQRGRWIWRLPEADHLFSRPAASEQTQAAAPVVSLTLTPDFAPDSDHLLALALQSGLRWPLLASSRNAAGQWYIRVYRAMGADPEVIVNDSPDGAVCSDYAAVKEWDEVLFRGRPPALVFDSGRIWWLTNAGRTALHLATITK